MLLLNDNYCVMRINMFGKKSLSAVLYWLFVLCFGILIILTFKELYLYINGNYSTIKIEGLPLPLVLMNLSVILPKAISFFLLIMIFKSFKSDIIFTKKTLTYLNIFTVFSLCMPIIKALFDYFLSNSEIELFPTNMVTIDIINIMVSSLLLGIFAAFIAAIFKRGFHLKTENDLTI